jgi:hypothetical protein
MYSWKATDLAPVAQTRADGAPDRQRTWRLGLWWTVALGLALGITYLMLLTVYSVGDRHKRGQPLSIAMPSDAGPQQEDRDR